MSIATKHGDAGQTGLAGGIRISKADVRVEAYGNVDELNTVLGFARSICQNKEIAAWTEEIQRTLFRVGSALATPPESKKQPPSGTCSGQVRRKRGRSATHRDSVSQPALRSHLALRSSHRV